MQEYTRAEFSFSFFEILELNFLKISLFMGMQHAASLGTPQLQSEKPAWVHADGIVLRPRAHSTVLFLQAINGSILS